MKISVLGTGMVGRAVAARLSELGHYTVTGRSGQKLNCRFAHVWTTSGEKLSRLHQTAESHLLRGVIADRQDNVA